MPPLPVIRQWTRQTRVGRFLLLLGHHARYRSGRNVPLRSEAESEWSSRAEAWVGLNGAEGRLDSLGDGRGLCVRLEGGRRLSCKSVGWARSGSQVIGPLELVEAQVGRTAWEVLRLCLVLMEIAENCVVNRRL